MTKFSEAETELSATGSRRESEHKRDKQIGEKVQREVATKTNIKRFKPNQKCGETQRANKTGLNTLKYICESLKFETKKPINFETNKTKEP